MKYNKPFPSGHLECKTCGTTIDSTHLFIFEYKDKTVDCFKCGAGKVTNQRYPIQKNRTLSSLVKNNQKKT